LNLHQDHDFSPALIVVDRMKENGRVTKGYNLNFYDADIDFLVGDNSFFIHDDFYIFGGQSVGFNTRKQNVTYDIDNPVLNSYVFKYNVDEVQYNENCFYQSEISKSVLETFIPDLTNDANIQGVFQEFRDEHVQFKENPRNLFKKMNNLFLGYESRYSGAFDL
jgi:hypothetical protein